MRRDIPGGGYNGRAWTNIFCIICSIILFVILMILMRKDQAEIEENAKKISQWEEEKYEEEQIRDAAIKQKEEDDSFYQKLADGFDVDILIVGDSIGAGSGTQTDGKQWYKQLQSCLNKNYHVNVSLTNVSMGGNASYAGYVRTMALEDDVDYDLAVICYGQNDRVDGFATNYESIIRAVKSKYSNCSIISILESAQREYTEKMATIQDICEHYGIPVADTIMAFQNSGKAYGELSKDGIHPNDAGQDIYFETVKKVVDENVMMSTGKMAEVDVINEAVNEFNNFQWYGIERNGFERIDDTTFVLKTSADGILGIDYTFESGDNKAEIYIDGSLFEAPTRTFDYDFSQRHIMVVNENCTVKQEIKVVFDTKKQADGFKGMCFSWK